VVVPGRVPLVVAHSGSQALVALVALSDRHSLGAAHRAEAGREAAWGRAQAPGEGVVDPIHGIQEARPS
jgi:hypothetical protein